MPERELVKKGDVIPILSGNWNECGLRFHAIGAFYYLGIVPSLSSLLFNDPDRMDAMVRDLRKMYNVSGPYYACLSQIFISAFSALQFFGYNETTDPLEIKSLKFAESLAKAPSSSDVKMVTFAFGNLQSSISRYHIACFESKIHNTQFFTPMSYQMLKDTLLLVAELFRRLNIPVSHGDDFYSNLLKALKNFHNRRKIDERRCGTKTLRALLFDAAIRDETRLSQAAGFTLTPKMPNIGNNVKLSNTNLSDVIHQMPNLAYEEGHLSNSIATTIGSTNSTCEILRERIENCEDKVNSIRVTLNQLSQINSRIDKQLDQASNALTNVLKEHIKVQERLVALKDKIASEKRTNRFLAFCAVILIISVLIRFIKFI